MREPDPYGFFRSEREVMMVERGALAVRQYTELLAQETLRQAIIYRQTTLGYSHAFGCGGESGGYATAMNHECAMLRYETAMARQERDRGNRSDLSGIVESEGDRERPKKVIETDSVSDRAAERLKQEMDTVRPHAGHGGQAVQQALQTSLLNYASERRIELDTLALARSIIGGRHGP